MTHSYGALISYMVRTLDSFFFNLMILKIVLINQMFKINKKYAATFPDEVEAIIAIDWLLAADRQYYVGSTIATLIYNDRNSFFKF